MVDEVVAVQPKAERSRESGRFRAQGGDPRSHGGHRRERRLDQTPPAFPVVDETTRPTPRHAGSFIRQGSGGGPPAVSRPPVRSRSVVLIGGEGTERETHDTQRSKRIDLSVGFDRQEEIAFPFLNFR
mmetsp:Transcript_18466/g.42622  ORF Transcript_18466/g.42622 Transcript_18466/m.42622 type:complete len:128 (-) Transcript_18466:149-532(-)